MAAESTLQTSGKANRQVQWLIALLFLLIAFVNYNSIYDVGVFLDRDSPWHLAAGDAIRDSGELQADPWAFTANTGEWYNIAWLYDITISVLTEWFGLEHVVTLNALLAAALIFLLARITMRYGTGVIATSAAMSIAVLMVATHFSLRPQLVSMLLMALSLLVLQRFRTVRDGRIWLLPLYTILWVNVHGGFLVIYTMIGAFWLEALYRKDKNAAVQLTLVGLACVAAALVNPFTYKMLYATLLTLQSPLTDDFIAEWLPPTFALFPHVFLYITAVFAVRFLVAPKLPFAEMVLVVFWALMTMKANRYAGILCIFATPYFALAFEAAVQKFKILRDKETMFQHDLANPRFAHTVMGVFIIALVFFWIPATRALVWTKPLLDANKYPVAEIRYVMQHFPDERVYNHYNDGGYIIYLARGSFKHFIDGRADTAFSREVIKDYRLIDEMQEGWEETLASYCVNVALLPNNYHFGYMLVRYDGWEVVFKGNVNTVYKRKQPVCVQHQFS